MSVYNPPEQEVKPEVRPVSKQRLWQRKMTAQGRCMICGRLAHTRMYCRKHAAQKSERVLRRYHAAKAAGAVCLLAAGLFTACASDPSWPYVRPETSATTRQNDFRTCQAKAAYLGMVSSWAAISDHVCMTQLGYTQTQWTR